MTVLYSHRDIVIITYNNLFYLYESNEFNRSCFCSQCYIENDDYYTFKSETIRVVNQSSNGFVPKAIVSDSIENLINLAITDCKIYIEDALKAKVFRLTYSIADLYLQTKLYDENQIKEIKYILTENYLEHDFQKIYSYV